MRRGAVATSPYRLAVGIIWGMVLGLLVDLASGMGLGVLVNAGLGAAMAKVDRSGTDRKFQGRVRGVLKPGTSTLAVLVVNMESTDAVAEASAATAVPFWSPPCPRTPGGGSRTPF